MCNYVDTDTSMDTVSMPDQCTCFVGRYICIDVDTTMCMCSPCVDVGEHVAWVVIMVITEGLPPVPSHNMTVRVLGAYGLVCSSSIRLFYLSNSIDAIYPCSYKQHSLYHFQVHHP